jgi:reticulon-4-interacting protein 1, mitochondrial
VVPRTGRQGHVLVKVISAGLNPVDAKNVIGDKLPESWTTVHGWIRRYILSHKIPGFDFAGVCMEDVSLELPNSPTSGLRLRQKLSVGDNVFGIMPPFGGTLAEYISVPLHQICRMPHNLSFVEAAALPLVG